MEDVLKKMEVGASCLEILEVELYFEFFVSCINKSVIARHVVKMNQLHLGPEHVEGP